MKELDKLTTEELGKLFPIQIADYCPGWPLTFLDEKRQLEKALAEIKELRIDHIGSTAIPGLAAKPIIDLLIQVAETTPTQTIIDTLQKEGYHYIHRPENPAPHMMFVKGYTEMGYEGQAFHVHVRYTGQWDELCFRDALLKNPEIAAHYVKIKKELAAKFKHNRELYTKGKTEFVKLVCSKAQPDRLSDAKYY